jgi:hypothetical protein
MMTDRVSASLQLGELKRLSRSMRKLARELRRTDKYEVSFLPLTDLITNESMKCMQSLQFSTCFFSVAICRMNSIRAK